MKKRGIRNYTKIPLFGEYFKKSSFMEYGSFLEDQGRYNILTISRTPCAR